MVGEKNLSKLLTSMNPKLIPGDYVFTTLSEPLVHHHAIVGMMREEEGFTYIMSREYAEELKIKYSFASSWITLEVHSSLEAVGLTAAFSTALAENGISCNVVAGYHHDHIFVSKDDSAKALRLLSSLAKA